mmetsp:Transcript_86269/g.230396  ORF Transcript_86269/g.230396 Transcript_86269/m.230396 type:complete len:105 (-) Transcript_86269:474-788(-)
MVPAVRVEERASEGRTPPRGTSEGMQQVGLWDKERKDGSAETDGKCESANAARIARRYNAKGCSNMVCCNLKLWLGTGEASGEGKLAPTVYVRETAFDFAARRE